MSVTKALMLEENISSLVYFFTHPLLLGFFEWWFLPLQRHTADLTFMQANAREYTHIQTHIVADTQAYAAHA